MGNGTEDVFFEVSKRKTPDQPGIILPGIFDVHDLTPDRKPSHYVTSVVNVKHRLVEPLMEGLPSERADPSFEDAVRQTAVGLARVQTRLEEKSFRDWMTGCLSFATADKALEYMMMEAAINKGKYGVGICRFDLDNFSGVAKPKEGEQRIDADVRGDATLKLTTKTINEIIKDSLLKAHEDGDVKLFKALKAVELVRLGGDEFAIFGNKFSSREDWESFLQVIRQGIQDRMRDKGGVTASMGSVFVSNMAVEALSPGKVPAIDGVMNQADQLSEVAKRRGKNQIAGEEVNFKKLRWVDEKEELNVFSGVSKEDHRFEELTEKYNTYLLENFGRLGEVKNTISRGLAYLEFESATDDLTGLLSRAAGMERLEKIIETESKENFPLTVLKVDIDRFKDVNTVAGHEVGDMVLRTTARELQRLVDNIEIQGGAAFAIRFRNGGEFILVAEDLNYEKGVELVKQMLVDSKRTLGQIKTDVLEADLETKMGKPVTLTAALVPMEYDNQIGAEGIVGELDEQTEVAQGKRIHKGYLATGLSPRDCLVWQDRVGHIRVWKNDNNNKDINMI